MKKKIAAIMLALLMLVPCAQASEGTWAEGLSPQKPYSGSKEVDFNESIGLFFRVFTGLDHGFRILFSTLYGKLT